MDSKKPVIYISSLPDLGTDDIDLHDRNNAARSDLARRLIAANYRVEKINGQHSWVKNMLKNANSADAFIFPPMTLVPQDHPDFKSVAAQNWFEFFSVVTGIHVGNKEKYGAEGIAKPCIVMDPDKQWGMAIDLLKDLQHKGMFSSKVEEIVQVVGGNPDTPELNANAVQAVSKALAENKGKALQEVHSQFPATHNFKAFRHNSPRCPFGVAIFGSATTKEKSYIELTEQLSQKIGERGWRLISGAGREGCMGAADRGFDKGRREFNKKFPNSYFKPAHIGVSTQSILRLEGPPPNLNQLIISDDIYQRMKIMISGRKSSVPIERVRDATRVMFVAPGGTGTLHEFATLMQLATNGGMVGDRKIVLLDFPNHLNPQEGFWKPLIETAKKLGFYSQFEIAHTPEEAMKIADRHYQYWLELHPEYAKLPQLIVNPREDPNQKLLWTDFTNENKRGDINLS